MLQRDFTFAFAFPSLFKQFLKILSKRLEGQLDETNYKALEMARASTVQLLGTINDLTEITKLQKDGDIKKETVRFDELLADVRRDVGSLLAESQAQLNIDFEVNEILYARKNLRSILYNLLSNALKYRSPDRPSQVRLASRMVGGTAMLEVADNGLGLQPEQLEKLFTMFKRFHAHVEGTGIGLYMIRRIVENNGGLIEVESKEGEGTRFRIYFGPRI